MALFQKLTSFLESHTKKEKAYINFIKGLTGYKPINLSLYQLSVTHTSVSEVNDIGIKESNERLEFLGDSVLDLIVADSLFRSYPYEAEGFLTEIRSRIVNREQLNYLAHETGLVDFVNIPSSDGHNHSKNSYIYGNAMEAFIGALYLDMGFDKTQKIVLKLIYHFLNIPKIITHPYNFKSILLEWGQKENKSIAFNTLESNNSYSPHRFQTTIKLNGIIVGNGADRSKKKSEQNASERACKHLNLIDVK